MALNTMNILEWKRKQEEEKWINVGFTIRQVGIGDGLQFSSLPENFYKKTGQKLIDVSKPWYLDHNPYVLRNENPKRTIELWNHPPQYEWPHIRDSVYMNNAEIHASVMGISDPVLTHPKVYRFDDFPFYKRKKILFHPFGKSHGALPDHVIEHIVKKYKHKEFYQIGSNSDPSIPGIQRITTQTLWDLTKVISECRMLIGVDSGPSWIAACFPDIIIKKIRIKFQYGYCEPKDWVPMDVKNKHSFWDDLTLFDIYNCFEEDTGFTKTYKRI